jgi:putative nucleotidyltransferase with HDIG domain
VREFLESKFPELNQITDADLREKTLRVMLEAIELSGFAKEQLEKVPFTLLIPGTPVSLIDHIRAVTETAIGMAESVNKAYPDRIKIEIDYMIAGGLLHDIGKFSEYKFEDGKFSKSDFGKLVRHPFSGAGLALKHDLPAEVIHLIATHAGEGDKGYRSPASVVLHHADFTNFEALGGKI